MQYNFISIEGNIGSGKTSLATRLAELYNAHLILEKFEDNPFLPPFYREPERYAFPLELFFLAERYQQMQHLSGNQDLFKTGTISDYIFPKSSLFAGITLNPDERKLYGRMFQLLQPAVPQPDLVVYLHCPLDRLIQQIQKRSRGYEQWITKEYLMKIQNAYLMYFKMQLPYPVLIIDTTHLDFVRREADFDAICQWLEDSYPAGTHFLFPETTGDPSLLT